MITVRTRLTINGNSSYFDTSFSPTTDDPRDVFNGIWLDPSEQWNFESVIDSVNEQLTNRGHLFQLAIAESYPLDQPYPIEKLPVDANKQQNAVIRGMDRDGLYRLTFHYGTETLDTGEHTLIELVNAVWGLRARTSEDDSAPQIRDGVIVGNHVLPIEIGLTIYQVGTENSWWGDTRYSSTLDNLNNLIFEDGVDYVMELFIAVTEPGDIHTLHPEDNLIHTDGRTPFNVTFSATNPSTITNAAIERHTLMGDTHDDSFTSDSMYTTDFDKNYLLAFNIPDMILGPRLTLLNVSGTSDVVEIIRSLPGQYPIPLGFPRVFSDISVEGDIYYLNDLLPYSIRCDLSAGTVESTDLIIDEAGGM